MSKLKLNEELETIKGDAGLLAEIKPYLKEFNKVLRQAEEAKQSYNLEMKAIVEAVKAKTSVSPATFKLVAKHAQLTEDQQTEQTEQVEVLGEIVAKLQK